MLEVVITTNPVPGVYGQYAFDLFGLASGLRWIKVFTCDAADERKKIQKLNNTESKLDRVWYGKTVTIWILLAGSIFDWVCSIVTYHSRNVARVLTWTLNLWNSIRYLWGKHWCRKRYSSARWSTLNSRTRCLRQQKTTPRQSFLPVTFGSPELKETTGLYKRFQSYLKGILAHTYVAYMIHHPFLFQITNFLQTGWAGCIFQNWCSCEVYNVVVCGRRLQKRQDNQIKKLWNKWLSDFIRELQSLLVPGEGQQWIHRISDLGGTFSASFLRIRFSSC